MSTIDSYILRDGKPVAEPDLLRWATWMENNSRSLESTQLGVYRVSTVFLGLDHSFHRMLRPELSPVLWETMVFGEEKQSPPIELDGYSSPGFKYHESMNWQERYTSEAEAREGHAKAVQWVKDNLLPLRVVEETA